MIFHTTVNLLLPCPVYSVLSKYHPPICHTLHHTRMYIPKFARRIEIRTLGINLETFLLLKCCQTCLKNNKSLSNLQVLKTVWRQPLLTIWEIFKYTILSNYLTKRHNWIISHHYWYKYHCHCRHHHHHHHHLFKREKNGVLSSLHSLPEPFGLV